MSNYIGVRCPVCNKKFAEADDIVVCPVCGAPHHRNCYMEANRCAFVADHLSGKEWSDPAGQAPSREAVGEESTRECPRCGASNQQQSIFCQVCGSPLALQPPGGDSRGQFWGTPGLHTRVDTISMAYGGIDPDEEIGGESAKDIARYIGNGSAYYLPRFRLISERLRTFPINFAALFFNFFYYFYRRMYLVGGVLLGLYMVSVIPSFLYTREIMPEVLYAWGLGPAVEINQIAATSLYRLTTIARAVNFFIGAAASLCANRFYYNRVIASVRKIRTGEGMGKTPQQYEQMLSQAGGCSKVAVVTVALTLLTLLFLVSSALALQLVQ